LGTLNRFMPKTSQAVSFNVTNPRRAAINEIVIHPTDQS
jgi:hypothetical protein